MERPKLTERGERLKLRAEFGKLDLQRLALAAYVGDPDARLVLTLLAEEGNGEGAPKSPEAFDPWLAGLKDYGQGVVLRAGIALSRQALFHWRDIRRQLKEKSAGHLCYPLAYDLVIAAEACLTYPLPDRVAHASKLIRQAEDAPHDLEHEDLLQKHGQLMALFVQTARLATQEWQQAFDELRRNTLRKIWPEEDKIRRIVRTHLVPWALNEHEFSDPIMLRPTQGPRDSVADPD